MMKPLPRYRKIGLLLRPSGPIPPIAQTIMATFGQYEFSFLAKEKPRLKSLSKKFSLKFYGPERFYQINDALITLGGDGTLLSAFRHCTLARPIFSINLGQLGFITQFSLEEAVDHLALAFAGKLSLTKVHHYQVEIKQKGKKIFQSSFVNDAVISHQDISRMIPLDVFAESCPRTSRSSRKTASAEHRHCKNELIYHLAGDGLIVSTALGSTAYSLAAGGPILHPDVLAVLLTPICPHSMFTRPMAIGCQQAIIIKIPSDQVPLSLTLDGQEVFSLAKGMEIKMKLSKQKAYSFWQNPQSSFYKTIKEKFLHCRKN